MKLIPVLLVTVISLSLPVVSTLSIQPVYANTSVVEESSAYKTPLELLNSLSLKPVTVCVQIGNECIDIGSGIYHTTSKTLLTAKHIALGEEWFVVNGLRLESNKVAFKIKENGKLISGIAYNKVALPKSQFGQSETGIGKDLAVMYYNESQLDTLKESAKSWNLPTSEQELASTMISSSLNIPSDIPTTMYSYRYRDSLGELLFTDSLNKINIVFSGAKLAGYQDIIYGNESIQSDGKEIQIIGYNTASGQEAFQAYTFPSDEDVATNVKTIITEFNGANPIGPGTSGSVVIGRSNEVTILGALVAVAGSDIPIEAAALNVLAVPKLAEDYSIMTGSTELEALALLRQTIPPAAVMVWTIKDIESL
jgi:hypothetical protein